jgi:hypothetical protein
MYVVVERDLPYMLSVYVKDVLKLSLCRDYHGHWCVLDNVFGVLTMMWTYANSMTLLPCMAQPLWWMMRMVFEFIPCLCVLWLPCMCYGMANG